MITTTQAHGDLRVMKLQARRLCSDAGRFASATHLAELLRPEQAALIDMSQVVRIDHSGIALLLSLHQGARPVAFFGLSPKVSAALSRLGFDTVLRLYSGLSDALASEWARRYRLCGRRAVLLSAGHGTRCAPLTRDLPKPMLDIFGKPVLHHLMDHLAGFGLKDFILNPGHLGPKIHRYFGDGHRHGYRVNYVNEGRYGPDGWEAVPLGSASSLARLVRAHTAFERDTFVLCGDAVTDLDMAAMLDAHKASGAMATIAALKVPAGQGTRYGIIGTNDDGNVTQLRERPARAETASNLVNTGLYLFSPEALSLLPDRPDLDIATDLLPAILRAGGRISATTQPFKLTDIGCPRDYFNALRAGLLGEIAVKPPHAANTGALFAHPTAQVSRKAKIDGPVYVGANADIGAGAHISGPAVVGSGCIVEGGTIVKNSALMPGTRVRRGAILVDMIASGQWSVSHPLADGRELSAPPAELVNQIPEASEASDHMAGFGNLRIAG